MFNRLSALSRIRRFFSPTESGPAWELNYLATADGCDRLVLVASAEKCADEKCGGERIVGVARYHRVGPEHADVAVVVEDEWQRHGLGHRLMAHLAVAALHDGIDAFDVSILGDNDAALGLLRRMSDHTAGRRPALSLKAGVYEGSVPLVA
jgi:ribosomal protein S18 acetylase RimI-like enzyme